VRVNIGDFFQLHLSNTRGHPYKLFKDFSNSSVRSTYFCERVGLVNIWNRLKSQIVDFSYLYRFRKSIEITELDVQTSLARSANLPTGLYILLALISFFLN